MSAEQPVALHGTLVDFITRSITVGGVTKAVHVAGAGAGVIVLHEMPGIGPHVLRFARWVRDAGFTVWLPSLFGEDLATPTAAEGAGIFRRLCVSAEFRAVSEEGGSPVTHWLRGLARQSHDECGGPGVGAVGMCFTGNFALSMMLEPAMLAPVLCAPALPLEDAAAIDIAPAQARMVRDRLERDDLTALGYRFAGDQYCRAERFAAYERALGSRFIARVLPDSAAGFNHAPPFHTAHVNFPHSVMTVHLIDEEGEPTLAARDEILQFLRNRLTGRSELSPPSTESEKYA